ncbi:hypothetical protein G7Y89_g14945 [Cudoniella acicularis]|uniref:Uncharacterized protein n=1 Tax=Cudoniella acicularis TaxID=354080 RepID=A0A8H4VQ91_9HELO|nr:hypothetical protein G7Y89_g14945 [Cudoniella acicularis]
MPTTPRSGLRDQHPIALATLIRLPGLHCCSDAITLPVPDARPDNRYRIPHTAYHIPHTALNPRLDTSYRQHCDKVPAYGARHDVPARAHPIISRIPTIWDAIVQPKHPGFDIFWLK